MNVFDSCQISATVFLSFQFSTPERERERDLPSSCFQSLRTICFTKVCSTCVSTLSYPPSSFHAKFAPMPFFHQPLWNSRIVWKFVIEQLQLTILEKDSFWSDQWLTLFLLRQTIIAVISLRIIAEEILKTFTLVNRYFLPRRNHDWETSFFPLFKRNYRFARWKFSPFKQNARQLWNNENEKKFVLHFLYNSYETRLI